MKFKIDENLPEGAKLLLNERGHDCHSVYDEGIQGVGDDALIEICKSEGRHLITQDFDFADIVTYPPGEYCGIIVLRLSRQDATLVVDRLSAILGELEALELSGHLAIINDHRIRYR